MPRFHPTCHDRQEGKAQLGDVIVADPAWDFQSGKLKIEGRKAKMEFSLYLIPISHFLQGRLEQMTSDRGLVAKYWINLALTHQTASNFELILLRRALP